MREAKAFEAAERTARNHGSWIDPTGGSITFEDWAWRWLELDVAKSPGARATDTSIIRSALVPALGLPHARRDPTPRHPGSRRGWSRTAMPRTVRRRYATLAAILNVAVNIDLIGRSPCRGVKLPPVSPARHRIIGPGELDRLAAELPVEYRTMLYVGATLGLRIGEAAGLRVRSVDLERQTITVTESVGEAGGHLFTKGPKTSAGRRIIPLPPPMVAMLLNHIQHESGLDPDSHLFRAPGGGPLRPNHFRARVWRPACKRAGLDGLGFHDLRRSSATVMVANGVSVRDAQQILGHSDPRLLIGVYAQATEAGMRTATAAAAAHFMSPAAADERPVRRPSGRNANVSAQPRSTADAGKRGLKPESRCPQPVDQRLYQHLLGWRCGESNPGP